MTALAAPSAIECRTEWRNLLPITNWVLKELLITH
jgi:hypothetical protein